MKKVSATQIFDCAPGWENFQRNALISKAFKVKKSIHDLFNWDFFQTHFSCFFPLWYVHSEFLIERVYKEMVFFSFRMKSSIVARSKSTKHIRTKSNLIPSRHTLPIHWLASLASFGINSTEIAKNLHEIEFLHRILQVLSILTAMNARTNSDESVVTNITLHISRFIPPQKCGKFSN